MKKCLCLLLSCSMMLFGCADNFHYSDHCDEFSAARVNLKPEERNHYTPILTPTTDTLTECYCYTEDAVIVTGGVVLVGAAIVGLSMAYGTYNP